MEINYGVNNFIKVSLPLEKVYHDATLFGDGTKQKPLRVIGGGGGGASLPTMTGNSGKFLTTNGTVASWAVVNALPTQTGNSGKILSTNGTVASWIAVPTALPTLGTATQLLTVNSGGTALAYVSTLAAANIPNLDTAKLTTGTLGVARGGTGLTALGTALRILRVNAGGTALEYAAAPSATPAGSNTEIQFNNAGAFGASANLTWTGTNLLVNASTAIGSLTSPSAQLSVVKNSIGITQINSNGISLENNTAATVGTQEMSPGLRFRGSGWKTNATAASQPVEFLLDVLPGQSSASPLGIFQLKSSINGAAYNNVFRARTDGTFLLGNSPTRPQIILVSGVSSPIIDGTAFQVSIDNSAQRTTTGFDFFISSTERAYTSGSVDVFRLSAPFSPTSGTGIFNMMAINPTINQTGGANGITRGLHILPTLTSAADWRAIEATGQTRLIGTGATAATSALLVTNSSGTETLRVRDDGEILINKDQSVTTQSSAVITVQSADTNTNLVLSPKGTGAIIAGPPPDGTVVGGNARGANAVDLQRQRDNPARIAANNHCFIGSGFNNEASGGLGYAAVVAGHNNRVTSQYSFMGSGINNLVSGQNSFIGSGELNTASGTFSTVTAGRLNTASAEGSAVSGGLFGLASLYGQSAYASGGFDGTAPGDAQTSTLVMRRAITGTSQTELFLNGSSIAAILPLSSGATNARVWEFQISITGICAAAGNGTTVLNDALGASYRGTIKRVGSTTALVGTLQEIGTTNADASMSTTVVTIDANDANESLRVQITPPSTAGTTTITRWVAKVELVEVGR